MTEQGLWNFWGMVVLHRKSYFSKNWQMSAPLKIDVFGLSDLHMQRLTKFYFVSGVNSCGLKTRSFDVPGEWLGLTKSYLFQELSFVKSAPVKVDIFGLSGQQIEHLTKVVFTTRVTAVECKRNRLWRKRISQTTMFRSFFYSLSLLIDRKHRQLNLLYKYLEKIAVVTAQLVIGRRRYVLEPSFWCWTESS